MVYGLQGALPVRFAAPKNGSLDWFPYQGQVRKIIMDSPVAVPSARAHNLAKNRWKTVL
jgi:hypothetical protein